MPSLRRWLQRQAILQWEVHRHDELAAVLDAVEAQGIDLLVINGGDGTVQQVLTAWLRRKPAHQLPLLALTAGGTTNMNAGDVGLPGSPLSALQRLTRFLATCSDDHALTDCHPMDKPAPRTASWFRRAPTQLAVIERPLLQVRIAQQVHYGFFMGAGLVVKGTQFFHHATHGWGLRHEALPTMAMIRMLWALLRREAAYVTPHPLTLTVNHQAPQTHDLLLMLITSLDRLFLNTRPYWGTGALHYTALTMPLRYGYRVLPRLLRGHQHPLGTAPNGYFSDGFTQLQFAFAQDNAIVLDGEWMTVKRAQPILIEASAPLRFIKIVPPAGGGWRGALPLFW